MSVLLTNIIGTVVGGLLLTLILFLLKEYLFNAINLTGEWEAIIEVEKTSYNPFKNLKTEYRVHLLQKGYELSGSGEKIKDIKPSGEIIKFIRKNRVINKTEGYYEKKYLTSSTIYLHVIETGRIRETRATYILKITNKNKLDGTFTSTAADASGRIIMVRK